MYGWEFFHGGWLWLIPVVFMLLICLLMMRGGIRKVRNGKFHRVTTIFSPVNSINSFVSASR